MTVVALIFGAIEISNCELSIQTCETTVDEMWESRCKVGLTRK